MYVNVNIAHRLNKLGRPTSPMLHTKIIRTLVLETFFFKRLSLYGLVGHIMSSELGHIVMLMNTVKVSVTLHQILWQLNSHGSFSGFKSHDLFDCTDPEKCWPQVYIVGKYV